MTPYSVSYCQELASFIPSCLRLDDEGGFYVYLPRFKAAPIRRVLKIQLDKCKIWLDGAYYELTRKAAIMKACQVASIIQLYALGDAHEKMLAEQMTTAADFGKFALSDFQDGGMICHHLKDGFITPPYFNAESSLCIKSIFELVTARAQYLDWVDGKAGAELPQMYKDKILVRDFFPCVALRLIGGGYGRAEKIYLSFLKYLGDKATYAIQDITDEDCFYYLKQEAKRGRKSHGRTIQGAIESRKKYISAAFNKAIELGITNSNPMKRVKVRKVLDLPPPRKDSRPNDGGIS